MNRFIYLYVTVGDTERRRNSYFLASYMLLPFPLTENLLLKGHLSHSLLFPKTEGVASASRYDLVTLFIFHRPGLLLMLL